MLTSNHTILLLSLEHLERYFFSFKYLRYRLHYYHLSANFDVKLTVPGAVEAIRALAASADAVRVSWLPPSQRAGRLTHYTLYTRELGK